MQNNITNTKYFGYIGRSPKYGLPLKGTSGQILAKSSDKDGDVVWINNDEVNSLPNGGTTGQVLAKNSNTNGDAGWTNNGLIPTGGTSGQILTKNSNTNFDSAWGTRGFVPSGGTTNQILAKSSNSDYATTWIDNTGGGSLSLASQLEAETGLNNTKAMTPLRTADAIKGFQFAVQSGGLSRTIVDRSRDWIIANDFSDGTGSASNDTAALQAAINYCKSNPDKGVLITRPFTINDTIVIDGSGVPFSKGILISGGGQSSSITPATSMTTMIQANYGPFTIKNLIFHCSGKSITNCINVNKPGGNAGEHQLAFIENNVFQQVSGICINMEYWSSFVQAHKNQVYYCGTFWQLNGFNVDCLGTGNMLNSTVNGVRLLRGSNPVGIEGFKYNNNVHLASTNSIYCQATYWCDISHNMFGSHINDGVGIHLDSTNYPNTSNIISHNFIGGEDNGNFGILANGTGAACEANNFYNNEITFWKQANIAIAASNPNSGTIVRDNVSRGSTHAQAAIVMVDTLRALVKNNYIGVAGGTCLLLSGNSTGSIYGNNSFLGGSLSVGGSGWSLEGANR